MAEDTAAPKEKTGAESPTTARPIDFDDDQQETGILHPEQSSVATEQTATSPQHRVRFDGEDGDTTPPTKPPRPVNPQEQAEAELIQAFPDTDTKVVKAVFSALNYDVERAFDALLRMNDPTYQTEAPPAQPPRPTAQQRQIEQDEVYARQLAQQYEGRSGGYGARSSSLPQGGGQPARPPAPAAEQKEYSFFDDDLPEIRENLRQGFMQTQTKISKFLSDFRKRIDGDEEDDPAMGYGSSAQPQNTGTPQFQQSAAGGTYRGPEAARTRRSTDRDRYDDDPQVLSSNFTELELRDEESEEPPQKPPRPKTNPHLFNSSGSANPLSGPVDEVDAADSRSAAASQQDANAPGGKPRKWQPLTSVAPNPDTEDNDPFSLGDSDEERDAKSKDLRADDTERLKSMAASAPAATQEGENASNLTLEPAEKSGSQGTRNKEMEDLMEK